MLKEFLPYLHIISGFGTLYICFTLLGKLYDNSADNKLRGEREKLELEKLKILKKE